MHRTLLAAVLGLGWTLNASAGPHKDDVLPLLSGFEDTPSADALRAVPGIEQELLDIAQDATVSKSVRMRAVHALGWFPSDDGRTYLTILLDGTDHRMARKAVYALGNGWGTSALPELQRAMADDDTQLRLAAVSAISMVGGDASRAALNARLSVEENDTVRQSITSALGR